MRLTEDQKHLRRRIVEMTIEAGTSHLGSCLSAVDIIEAIYMVKKREERFVLSSGHAAAAWYAVLEKRGYLKNPRIGVLHAHPQRNPKIGLDTSSGSLGQGLPIAVGIALSDRRKRVFCVISDGECQEGSIWEALRIADEQKLGNLKVAVNANGWGAYGKIDLGALKRRFVGFGYKTLVVDGHNTNLIAADLKSVGVRPLVIFARTNVSQLPFLMGQDALYHVMSGEEFKIAMEYLR